MICSQNSLLCKAKEKKSGIALKNIFSHKIGIPSKSENSDTIQNELTNIPESFSKLGEQLTDEVVLCNSDDITSLNTSFNVDKKDGDKNKVQSPDFTKANFVFQINTPGLVLSDSQIQEIVSRVKIKNEPISLKQQLHKKQNFR